MPYYDAYGEAPEEGDPGYGGNMNYAPQPSQGGQQPFNNGYNQSGEAPEEGDPGYGQQDIANQQYQQYQQQTQQQPPWQQSEPNGWSGQGGGNIADAPQQQQGTYTPWNSGGASGGSYQSPVMRYDGGGGGNMFDAPQQGWGGQVQSPWGGNAYNAGNFSPQNYFMGGGGNMGGGGMDRQSLLRRKREIGEPLTPEEQQYMASQDSSWGQEPPPRPPGLTGVERPGGGGNAFNAPQAPGTGGSGVMGGAMGVPGVGNAAGALGIPGIGKVGGGIGSALGGVGKSIGGMFGFGGGGGGGAGLSASQQMLKKPQNPLGLGAQTPQTGTIGQMVGR